MPPAVECPSEVFELPQVNNSHVTHLFGHFSTELLPELIGSLVYLICANLQLGLVKTVADSANCRDGVCGLHQHHMTYTMQLQNPGRLC